MYINSISGSNNLSAVNPQFKSKSKLIQAISTIASNPVKIPTKTIQALFLGGALMFGATGCIEKQNTPTTKEINEEEVAKYTDLALDEVKITEGLVKDRSEDEIRKATGLTKVEFDKVLEALDSIRNMTINIHKFGDYLGTTYNSSVFGDSFFINFGNDVKFKYSYNKEFEAINFHQTNIDDAVPADVYVFKDKSSNNFTIVLLTVIPSEKNSTFINGLSSISIITNCEPISKRILYTKDGRIKSEVDKQLEREKAIAANKKRIEQISILKNINIDSYTIANIMYTLGYNNIDNTDNIIYLDNNNVTYRLNIKQRKDKPNVFAGFAEKVTSNGNSEIYAMNIKIENLTHSDRIIISKINKVQDGLEDDAPKYNKNMGTVQIRTGSNRTDKNYRINGAAKKPFLQNILNKNTFYDGNISNSEVVYIDEVIKEQLPDFKITKIITIDKETGNINVKGQ